MPFFRKKPVTIEAYRLPLAGQEPSDGLVFFLEANGHPAPLIPSLCAKYAGCWMVRAPNGYLAPYGPEKFHEEFEQV